MQWGDWIRPSGGTPGAGVAVGKAQPTRIRITTSLPPGDFSCYAAGPVLQKGGQGLADALPSFESTWTWRHWSKKKGPIFSERERRTEQTDRDGYRRRRAQKTRPSGDSLAGEPAQKTRARAQSPEPVQTIRSTTCDVCCYSSKVFTEHYGQSQSSRFISPIYLPHMSRARAPPSERPCGEG